MASAAEARLDAPAPSVRRAALHCTAKLSAPGTPERRLAMLHKVMDRASDSDVDVRAAVLQGMTQLAEVGDKAALAMTQRALEDKSPSVRRQALQTLEQLVVVADNRALRLVANAASQDKDMTVRRVAEEVNTALKSRQHQPSSLWGLFRGRSA
ncbi:unnamed protein product [Effrenium voratum]|uniref:HEAT repeat domain-containing protein n=1 Tax=Effrenium voratum TaxID=2562239 RepID=A0AA36IIH4_9DINO|nr:unnamed protein product [Effrenium voratum]CAJ1388248.1 unnamed protein product [Effrenium voratum]CAJ1416801.1 unnamed protein product [Effrenium voratum]